MQLLIDLLLSPDEAFTVLRHFESGGSDTASVHGLGGRDDDTGLCQEELKGVVGSRHISDFDIILDAVGCDLLSVFHMNVILHSGRHNDVGFHAPRLFTGMELNAELIRVILDFIPAAVTHFDKVSNFFRSRHAIRVIDVSIRAGEGHDFRAQFGSLLADSPGHVAEASAGDGFTLHGIILMFQDVFEVIDSAEAGSLRADKGTAVALALTGKHAVFESALKSAVLAIEVTDFPCANAHIAGRNVDIGSNVAVKRLHKALAEAHDFSVRFPGGIEVRAALTAADGESGKGILEDLLEAQEFDDRGVYRGMEPQAALVGADGPVELAAVADVGVPGAVVQMCIRDSL